tara:strand:- start:882 stop:1172 length:291 start_codon:yes stop_codon:yes gene_type:complete
VLESDHRAIEDKHGHNDDEDDEDKEGSPGENAQLRLSGEHPGALGRSYGVRSYRTAGLQSFDVHSSGVPGPLAACVPIKKVTVGPTRPLLPALSKG